MQLIDFLKKQQYQENITIKQVVKEYLRYLNHQYGKDIAFQWYKQHPYEDIFDLLKNDYLLSRSKCSASEAYILLNKKH